MFWRRWAFCETLIGQKVVAGGELGKYTPKGEGSMNTSADTGTYNLQE